MNITLPTIHTNGTSALSLARGYGLSRRLLNDAINVVEEQASPNGRDYYPQGSSALSCATKEHAARVTKLREVYAELVALEEHCVDAAEARRAT